MAADVYNPELWNNFFVLVGTGAAALTGLVFVAISVNLRSVIKDATHTYRAINMLSGFTSAFIVSALALMGRQTHRTFGVEWLLIALAAAAVNTNGYVRGYSQQGSRFALTKFRVVAGSACYVGQVVGASLLLSGRQSGTYVGAIALIANFAILISGSWLLIVGALDKPEGSAS